MMDKRFYEHVQSELDQIKQAGLYKIEHEIASSQAPHIRLEDGREVINFCANNYLGFANHPEVIRAAKESLDRWGFGVASVRFICGTQTIHHELETRLSRFFSTEATILYSSCFDANGGLFEPLLGCEDAVFSDELNHASIIDGIRLCKAERYRYGHSNMSDLEEKLRAAKDARFRLIATDGVFSMDGAVANLKAICDLADRYNAIVMVDDCHAIGFMGHSGRGTAELLGVLDRVDIITGTLGKALGGASGGFTTGKREVIELLRQRSRPYLFSNSLAPNIVSASLKVLDLIEEGASLRQTLHDNSRYFKQKIQALGFTLASESDHPIISIMLGDAHLAATFAKRLLAEGIYVVGFSYPVVPVGKARIRTQMSAAHTKSDLDKAIGAFHTVGKELGVLAS